MQKVMFTCVSGLHLLKEGANPKYPRLGGGINFGPVSNQLKLQYKYMQYLKGQFCFQGDQMPFATLNASLYM